MESIYHTPQLGGPELEVITQIERRRDEVTRRYGGGRVLRWAGTLRRMSLARNVQASNSIEGYNATLDDVIMAIDGDQPLEASDETAQALAGYRDAMTYVLQIATDTDIAIDTGLLRSLHFMMLKSDLTKRPGRWRPGPIHVYSSGSGQTVYAGPDRDRIPALIEAMVAGLTESKAPPMVAAAMAHLNLVMIHPFADGNGRMGRCVQTLMLARGGITHPVFMSIEEYLGQHTPAYYQVLADVGQGSWNPGGDALPWVRFCLLAHLRQAETVRRRFTEAEELWIVCEQLASRHRLSERTMGALWEGARGLQLRRSGYVKSVLESTGEQIANLTASRDLQTLVYSGLLEPRGETRGRYYIGSQELQDTWRAIRERRPDTPASDPFG